MPIPGNSIKSALIAQRTPDAATANGSRGVKASELLRKAIAAGRLKPGARALESELAAQLNMSRTPVREARRLLKLMDWFPWMPRWSRGYETRLSERDGALRSP
jgi:hypothetical protein